MQDNTGPNRFKYAPAIYIGVIILWTVYVALVMLAPQNEAAQRYNLSNSTTNLLRLSFMLPLLAIWLVSLRGILSIKRYAYIIHGAVEERGIRLVANGLLWIIAYFIVSTVVAATLPYLAHTPYIDIAVTLRNHLPVIITGIGFWLVYIGSHHLRKATPFVTWTFAPIIIFVLYAVFAAIFTYSFLTTPLATQTNRIPLYALPREVLVFTMVLPLLTAWFAGIYAAVNVLKYARLVKGIIYRQGLYRLVYGLFGFLIFAMSVQILTAMTRFLAELNLSSILIVIYALLLCLAVGGWFIDRGAQRLAKIEVVE